MRTRQPIHALRGKKKLPRKEEQPPPLLPTRLHTQKACWVGWGLVWKYLKARGCCASRFPLGGAYTENTKLDREGRGGGEVGIEEGGKGEDEQWNTEGKRRVTRQA